MVDSGAKWRKVVSKMFMGEYQHNIDEKNRLIIPSKLRAKLGEQIVITKGLEKCLFIYSMEEWNKITVNLNKLSFTKKNARIFSRLFISSATVCEFDRQGRILISKNHKDYASLSKEVLILGVNERLEIWDKKSYEEFVNCYQDEYENLAEDLFGSEIDA